MPYVDKPSKAKYAGALESFPVISTVGDLTYIFTMLAHKYLQHHGLRFQHIAEVVGSLSCTLQEFYRRVVTPYEESKILQNGDASLFFVKESPTSPPLMYET